MIDEDIGSSFQHEQCAEKRGNVVRHDLTIRHDEGRTRCFRGSDRLKK